MAKPGIETRKEITAIAGLSEKTISKIEKIERDAVPAIVAAKWGNWRTQKNARHELQPSLWSL